MDSVQALEEALDLAKQLGFEVREDSFGGAGGACRIRGRKCLFVELNQSTRERLTLVLTALRGEPEIEKQPISSGLRRLLNVSRTA